MIGEKLSSVLSEIESALMEFEANVARPPQYTNEGFRAAVKIFLSAMLDKMWKLQEDENIDINTRADMAEKLGNELRNIVRIYTNIDTHNLYK
jgi:adenylate kinase